ncbi:hypothetical protein E2553_45625 [Paraburkholderia dipogonis]|uniref:Uncharacterized protein n=1 Tax=Paraburkholderia dipogonis TaxID=1211383 RepID=A0A4Y8MHP8_9BURK|nr:hypothetical protein [Paraburkholderia dipogonis]TFE36913.1 hypothetical protein E2553_45625 [Paraburkholderia dipogonis]
MQFVRKTLFATAAAASLIARAYAATTIQTLDITWYKDGQAIESGRRVISDDTGPAPYLHRSGKEVCYATCSGTPGAMRLNAEKMFVGRSLLIKPVSANAGKVRLSVSAIDTVLDDIRKPGTADCTSEVVVVHGYTASDLPVDSPMARPLTYR